MTRVRTTKTAAQIRSEIDALQKKEAALKESLQKAKFIEAKSKILADEGKILERLKEKYGLKDKVAALQMLALVENVRVQIVALLPVKRAPRKKKDTEAKSEV